MAIYNDETLLEMVELYAEETGNIASEEELSELFDNDILPTILMEHGEPGVEFTDTTMVAEAFNNWADSLCKEGEIHNEQYNNYEYVGKLS